jgi:hypothetical protein
MNHLRFMYAGRDRRLADRAHRRDCGLLASIWATRIAREIGVADPSNVGRAARYAVNVDGRHDRVPSWFPVDAESAEIIATARLFVALTNCRDRSKALLPSAALRELQRNPQTHGTLAVTALAAQFNYRQSEIAA